MLEDFDASRLEELAESLLADVSTDIEDDVARGGNAIAQAQGEPKSMFGSMVGTQAEELEPCKDINGSLSTPTHRSKFIKQEIADCMLPDTDEFETHELSALNVATAAAAAVGTKTAPIAPLAALDQNRTMRHKTEPIAVDECDSDTATSTAVATSKSANTSGIDETLYGTYDEENNCITVVLPDDDISHFEEVIEEVVCNDDDDEYLSQVSVLSPIPTNCPSPGYSSYYCGNSNDMKSPVSDRDSAYDSVLDSPPGRSISSSMNYGDDDFHYTDVWPDSFSELFPSLA